MPNDGLGSRWSQVLGWASALAEQRHENFDKDPGWDGQNNRSGKPETIRQDFGWSAGDHKCRRHSG
jgi:hypothetical protein